jgi:hypothetical protein
MLGTVGTEPEGTEPLGTPEGVGTAETEGTPVAEPAGVEGRVGTPFLVKLEPLGRWPQPVSHPMRIISMLESISMPAAPPRIAASWARASRDREAMLSPEVKIEITPRKTAPRVASIVPVMKEVSSPRRPVDTLTETSASRANESQNRTTALSSAPSEQLELVSQATRAVRTSTSRETAAPPLAQASRAA